MKEQNDSIYTAQWPKDSLSIDCFAHEVINFRYHWHPDLFELNILLSGRQYFCRGKENVLLEAGDVILVDPNTGHASYGQTEQTRALVLHFSFRALKPFVKKGEMLSFPACLSNANTRDDAIFRDIRRYAALTVLELAENGPYHRYAARASVQMLIAALCTRFSPETVPFIPEAEEEIRQSILTITEYLEQHFAEKITLEEMGHLTQYNRTYISTLFKKVTGIGFYDYLTRIRLQHALHDLATTDHTLTDIAVGNGFADLKSFNRLFKSLLSCSPREYRESLTGKPVAEEYRRRKIIPCTDDSVQRILRSWSGSDV